MILNNCSIKLKNYTFKEMAVEYLENQAEVTVHIGGEQLSIMKINEILNNNLNETIDIKGYSDDNQTHNYSLKHLNEMRLNLGPLYLSISFKKR